MKINADGYRGFEFVRLEIQDSEDLKRYQVIAIKIPNTWTGKDDQLLSLESICYVDLPFQRLRQRQRHLATLISNEGAFQPNSTEWTGQAKEGARCLGMIGIQGDCFLDKDYPERSYDIPPGFSSYIEGDFHASEPLTFNPGYIEHHLVQSIGCPWTTVCKLKSFRRVAKCNYIDAVDKRNELCQASQYSMSEAEKHLVDQSLLVQSIKPLEEMMEDMEHIYQGWTKEVST